ncbi:MAG TPA: hypothetical protein VGN72_10445 [Tepidisphaeraceae bacterium]|nr:hypothetical protein [Tepidisphaeraceae bacterium]
MLHILLISTYVLTAAAICGTAALAVLFLLLRWVFRSMFNVPLTFQKPPMQLETPAEEDRPLP